VEFSGLLFALSNLWVAKMAKYLTKISNRNFSLKFLAKILKHAKPL